MYVPTHVKLPRIWCTNPIGRAPTLKIDWYRGSCGTGGIRYWCDIPGAGARALWLDRAQIPLNTHSNWTMQHNSIRAEPRLPTGICSSVLATVLAIAQSKKADCVEFSSLLDILRTCTSNPGTRNRGPRDYYMHAVWAAIRLWQVLALDWERVRLPPAFAKVELGRPIRNGQRSICIELDKEWLQMCKKGVRVRLPLPMTAFSHNMILKTLACGNSREHINEFGYKASGNKVFTRSTPWIPYPTWVIVKEWYEAMGGMIDYKPDPPTIAMRAGKPINRLTSGKMMTITVIKP